MSNSQYQHLHCQTIDSVLVLTFVDERIRTDELTEQLQAEMLAAQAEFRPKKAVVNLQNVLTISSRGFGAILAFRQAFLRDKGEAIALCGASDEVADLLSHMRLSEKGVTAPALDPRPERPTAAPGPRPIFGILEPDVPSAVARLNGSA